MPFEWVQDITPSIEMTEGPYYGGQGPERSDIREKVIGTDFHLAIKVVEASSGRAFEGVLVDLWHCDPRGRYSGYDFDPDKQPESVEYQMPTGPETSLRGSQTTGRDGIVTFLTVFPGWYASRTPHLHVKVFSETTCILTTQLYVPDTFTRQFYGITESYRRTAERDTFNGTDIVLAKATGAIEGCWIEMMDQEGRLTGEALLAVDLNARSTRRPVPAGFRPPIGGLAHDKPVR